VGVVVVGVGVGVVGVVVVGVAIAVGVVVVVAIGVAIAIGVGVGVAIAVGVVKLSIRCHEPVQAHKAMMAQLWPMLQSSLLAQDAKKARRYLNNPPPVGHW
jgi:hypothetical protein